MKLVPKIKESKVDLYFNAFEHIAAALQWPNVWSLLLQCKLVGTVQEVCAALSIQESLDYIVLKASLLRANKLVPKNLSSEIPYTSENCTHQTFVEFALENVFFSSMVLLQQG